MLICIQWKLDLANLSRNRLWKATHRITREVGECSSEAILTRTTKTCHRKGLVSTLLSPLGMPWSEPLVVDAFPGIVAMVAPGMATRRSQQVNTPAGVVS